MRPDVDEAAARHGTSVGEYGHDRARILREAEGVARLQALELAHRQNAVVEFEGELNFKIIGILHAVLLGKRHRFAECDVVLFL